MLEQYRWQTFFQKHLRALEKYCQKRLLPSGQDTPDGNDGNIRATWRWSGTQATPSLPASEDSFLDGWDKWKWQLPFQKQSLIITATPVAGMNVHRIPFKNIWFIIWFWETRVWKSMTIRDNEKIWLQAWGQSLLHHWWEFFSPPRASTNCRGLSGQLTTNLYNCNQTFQRQWWNKRLVSNGGSAEVSRSSNQ